MEQGSILHREKAYMGKMGGGKGYHAGEYNRCLYVSLLKVAKWSNLTHRLNSLVT